MSEINFNTYKEGLTKLPELDPIVMTDPVRNKNISQIVFKLLQGENLTADESAKLKAVFDGEVDLDKLTKFLKLQGNAEGLTDTAMSDDPFAHSKSEMAIKPVANLMTRASLFGTLSSRDLTTIAPAE